MQGRDAEKCFKLHGFPPGHKFNDYGKSVATMVSAGMTLTREVVKDNGRVSLNHEQYSQLMVLPKPTNSQPFTSLVSNVQAFVTPFSTDERIHKMPGIPSCQNSFHHKQENIFDTPWILDRGATYHMNFFTYFLHLIKLVYLILLLYQMEKMFLSHM